MKFLIQATALSQFQFHNSHSFQAEGCPIVILPSIMEKLINWPGTVFSLNFTLVTFYLIPRIEFKPSPKLILKHLPILLVFEKLIFIYSCHPCSVDAVFHIHLSIYSLTCSLISLSNYSQRAETPVGENDIRETFAILQQYGGGALTDKHARVLVSLLTSQRYVDVIAVLKVVQNCAAFTSSQVGFLMILFDIYHTSPILLIQHLVNLFGRH